MQARPKSYIDMGFFPALVKKYEATFLPIVADVDKAITANLETLKSLEEEDEKRGIEEYYKNVPQGIYESTRFDSIPSYLGMYWGGVVLLYRSAKSQLLNYTESQKHVIGLLDLLGEISRLIAEVIRILKAAMSVYGFLPIGPLSSYGVVINAANDAFSQINGMIVKQKETIEWCFYIDEIFIRHSYSSLQIRPYVAHFPKHTVFPSDVDELCDNFEVLYSDIVEFGFRLILAKRDKNFPLDKEYQPILLQSLKTAESARITLQSALLDCTAKKASETKDEDSKDTQEGANLKFTSSLPIANRFTREYQVFSQVTKLRQGLQEMDCILAELEGLAEQVVYKESSVPANAGDFKDCIVKSRSFENTLQTFVQDSNRYLCYMKMLETSPVKNKRLPSQIIDDTAVIDKMESDSDSRPQSPSDTGDLNLTFEPKTALLEKEDENRVEDEFFYGRGKLGEDMIRQESDGDQADKLKGLMFSGVLSELKGRLSDRKVDMVSREQIALRKLNNEDLSTEGVELWSSDDEDEEDSVLQPRALFDPMDNVNVEVGPSLPEVYGDEEGGNGSPPTSPKTESFKAELLKAIKHRDNDGEVFE